MKDFILPDIGEGIVECELLEWLVAEGDRVEEDQPVAEVMTDKATVQIPAMDAGTVTKLYYKTGDIAKVHSPLFAQQIDGEADSSALTQAAIPEPQPGPQADNSAHSAPKQTNVAASEDFILPDIGEGIVECEVVKWLVSEGDTVTEDQPIVEVMTDKAVVEIPAKYSGVITKLHHAQGDIAKVHTPLYALAADADGTAPVASDEQPQTPTAVNAQSSAPAADDAPVEVTQGKALASPAVRRLAREKSIDIASVTGSGKKGRVLKQDIHAHLSAASAKTAPESASAPAASSGNRVEPIRGIKAAMAKQMSQSVFTIPHFSVSDEVNMDQLIALRNQLKPDFENKDVKLSFMPFFIKALSMALKAFPIINAQVNQDCTEVTYYEDHNIGIAVDSKIGLLVPNIKQVQTLSLFEVAQEVNRLIGLARDGKLSNADLKGGTISISNIGVIGGTTATPVINKPESAIVALGKMQRLPRFDDQDNVVAVNLMHVSWSGDHRIIDGATMVKFNNLWRSYLENPMTMLTDLR